MFRNVILNTEDFHVFRYNINSIGIDLVWFGRRSCRQGCRYVKNYFTLNMNTVVIHNYIGDSYSFGQ